MFTKLTHLPTKIAEDYDRTEQAYLCEIRDGLTNEVKYYLEVSYPVDVDPMRGDRKTMSLESYVQELIFDPDITEYVGRYKKI